MGPRLREDDEHLESTMKPLNIKLPGFVLALVLALVAVAANSQGAVVGTSRAGPSAESLFEDYGARLYGTAAGARTLERIYATGVALTPRNARLVRNALSRKITDDEAVALVRILGSLYSHDDQTQMNAEILRDLRSHTHSANDGIARAAVLSLSRTVYTDDLDSILSYASKRKLISKDEHYGELAHAYIHAPHNKQAGLVALIAKESNGYALEILAGSVNAQNVRRLDPAGARALADLFSANQPMFSMALSEFGYRDLLRYNYWLNATALLREVSGQGSYDDFVLAQLADDANDPRKALGFLGSQEGRPIIGKARGSVLLKKAAQRAVSYANSFPQDWLMTEMAKRITSTIGTH